MMSNYQHGFRKHRSRITNLFKFTTTVNEAFRRFLFGSVQMVNFGSSVSNKMYVKSGFPQGSHSYSGYFLNDLPSVISHSRVLMSADDVKIFYSHNNATDRLVLQSDLNEFYEWC